MKSQGSLGGLGGLGEALLLEVAQSRALPDRDRPQKPRMESADRLHAAIQRAANALAPHASRWANIDAHKAIRVGLEPPLTPAGAAIILWMTTLPRQTGSSAYMQHRVIDWWVQRGGADLAIDAALCVADSRRRPVIPGEPSPHQMPLIRLRTRLSHLPVLAWTAARDRARERVDAGLSAAQLLTLAFLFPGEAAWRMRAFADWQPDMTWGWRLPPMYALLASAQNGAHVRLVGQPGPRKMDALRRLACWTVIARLGAAVGPAILAINPGAELVAALDIRSRAAAFELALETVPRQALPTLAGLAPESRAIAIKVVANALESPSRTLTKAIAALTPTHRAALEIPDAEPQPQLVDVSAPLPQILQPDSLKTITPEAPAPEPRAAQAQMQWRPDERAAWLVLDTPSAPESPEAFVKRVIQRFGLPPVVERLATEDDPQALRTLRLNARARGHGVQLPEFAHVPYRLAVHLFNTLLLSRMIGTEARGLAWWLATAELDALPGVLRFIDEMPEAGLEAAAPFAVTAIAERAIDQLHRGQDRVTAALSWIRRHPALTVRVLIPRASGEASDARMMARQALNAMAASGMRDAIAAEAEAWATVGVAIMHGIDAGWMVGGRPRRVQAAPSWWASLATRPALADATPLPDRALETLRAYMTFGSAFGPHVRTVEAFAELEPGSLTAFLIEAFTAWDRAGRHKAHIWILGAMTAHLDPRVTDALGVQVVEWARHRRAAADAGIAAIGRLGTDRAIQHLGAISLRWRRGRMGHLARVELRRIAQRHGYTRHQMADRAQPTGGFDARGQHRFDFGPRHFDLVLDSALDAHLLDANAKTLKGLPALRKSDDLVLATAARAALKTARADAPRIQQATLRRLRGLIELGGVWTPADFDRFVRHHPVLGRVAPALAFGVYREDVCVEAAWLSDAGLRTLGGSALDLAPDDRLGIAHPVDLGVERAAALRAHFDQLERRCPVPQLDRGTPGLTEAERAHTTLPRFADQIVPADRLNALISQGVWFAYDPSEDRFSSVARALPFGGWVVLDLEFGPLMPRWGLDETALHPLRGVRLQGVDCFGVLPVRVICEVLNDLQWLVGPAG